MAKTIEIRWHGRGGQGAKTAALLLAEAAVEEGKYGQGFPEYGPERTGAPVLGFNRISDEPIRLHCQIANPDVVMVLDPTLMDTIDVTEGTSKDGIIIVNTPESPKQIRAKYDIVDRKIYTVNASQIALETIGRPIPNTVMMGALIRATNLLNLDTLIKGIEQKFTHKYNPKVAESNVKAIKRAYEEVVAE